MRKAIAQLVAESQTDGKPINESWSEKDIVHAILGAAGDDREKLKQGLGCLKKGQLKKIYAGIVGETAAKEEFKGAAEDGDEDDDTKMTSSKGASKKKDDSGDRQGRSRSPFARGRMGGKKDDDSDASRN